MRLPRCPPILLGLAILAVAPGRPAGAEPRDPLLAVIQRMNAFLHRSETDGVARDPRNLRNPPEEIRLSVVPQLLGYCELYRMFPNRPCYQDIVDRADFLADHVDIASSGGAFDGMLAFALLSAHAITGNDRYRLVAEPILDRCRALPGSSLRFNGGLMAAMGLAEEYRQTGDPASLRKVGEIVAGVARELLPDGSFPHYCFGSADIHYTAWMAMEMILIRQRVQDPSLDRMLAAADGFLRGRVDQAGVTHYEDLNAPADPIYYFSRATGCWFDYDTRGWVNELGYTALLFDHLRDPRYGAVIERLRDLQTDGAYADKWDFLPPPEDPIYPWATEMHSVIRTSVIFWSLASLYAERERRGPAYYATGEVAYAGGEAGNVGRPAKGQTVTAETPAAGEGGGEAEGFDPFADETETTATNQGSREPTQATGAARTPTATARADFGLEPMAPNPTRGPCAALLRLPRAMEVRADVYDASGRRVQELGSGASPEGERLLRWDGRDQRGARVPPGVYLLRVRAGIRQAVARVAIVS